MDIGEELFKENQSLPKWNR